MRRNCWPIRNFICVPYLHHRSNRRNESSSSSSSSSRNPRGFLATRSEPRLRHVGRLKVGSNEGKLSRVPISRDTFICSNMVGRASDGGRKQVGSPRDRNLSTCSTSCSGYHPYPLAGNLVYSSANFSARYAFLKSVSVFVRLIPAPIDTIFRSITILKILIDVRSTWEAKNFRILAPSRASPRQG